MKYIIVGPTIVNDIIFADGSTSTGHIGGAIFCVAGVKLWCDDCLYVSNIGKDFINYYGKWMEDNSIPYDGLNYILPHTEYTTLTYYPDGLHTEQSIYGEDYEKKIAPLDFITAKQIAANCNSDTKGIYIEAAEHSDIWDNLHLIKEKCRAKIMWEIPTSATMDEQRGKKVLEVIKKVDIYSINLPEAMNLFKVYNEQAAIDEIIALGIPCFFRVGKKGSHMICNGKSYFAPSITVGEIVDATGCGNSSTAAAMYCWCEEFHPMKVAIMANISAAYNLLQYGPYPAVTPEVRQRALGLVKLNS